MKSNAHLADQKYYINNLGFFAAIISALAWASTGVFVRFLDSFTSIGIVAGRCIVGVFGASLIFVFRNESVSRKTLKEKNTWVLAGIMIGYYLLAVAAFQIAPVAEVAILISTTPLFTLAYKKIKKMPISSLEIWGTVLATAGVIMIVIPSNNSSYQISSSTRRLLGDFLALIASGSMAIYSLIYRNLPASRQPPSQIVTFLTFFLGSIITVLLLALVGDLPSLNNFLDPVNLLLILGLGIFATVLPTLSYSYASMALPSIIVTSSRLLTPMLATVLAIIFLAEIPNILFWPGAVFLLIGLFLVTKN